MYDTSEEYTVLVHVNILFYLRNEFTWDNVSEKQPVSEAAKTTKLNISASRGKESSVLVHINALMHI